MKLEFDENQIRKTLLKSWSLKTTRQWTEEMPAAGQCNVTAFVVCELFGDEILETSFGNITHYYNRVDGTVYDFTDIQFENPIVYDDIVTTTERVRNTLPASEIDELKRAFVANWTGG